MGLSFSVPPNTLQKAVEGLVLYSREQLGPIRADVLCVLKLSQDSDLVLLGLPPTQKFAWYMVESAKGSIRFIPTEVTEGMCGPVELTRPLSNNLALLGELGKYFTVASEEQQKQFISACAQRRLSGKHT